MTKKRSQLLARLDPGGRVATGKVGAGKIGAKMPAAKRRTLLYSVLPVAALFAIGAGLVFQGAPDEMRQAKLADASVADAVAAEKAPRPQPQEPKTAAAPETAAPEGTAVAATSVEAAPEPLASNDPRFMPRPAGSGESEASSEPETASDFAAPYARAPAGMAADGSATPLDETETAAITTGSSAEPVEIAETAAEIARLEKAAATTAATDPDAAFVVQEGTTGEDDNNAPDPATMPAMTEEAVVKEYVTFRTGPSNDAEAIRTVPGGTALKAQPLEGCVHFCAVDIAGEKGFIYKAFLNFSEDGDATAASEPSEDADTGAALRL